MRQQAAAKRQLSDDLEAACAEAKRSVSAELREAAEKRAREAARSSRGKGKGRKTIAGGDIKSAEHITTNSAPRELSFD